LEIGKSIHLGDIKPPEGVELLGDKHISVVAVAAPRAEVEETPAAGAAPAAGDVEMIKEKKDEEGAAKGDAKGAAAKGEAKAGDKKAEAKPEAKAKK
jgi:large subunit ribosomal protein L25